MGKLNTSNCVLRGEEGDGKDSTGRRADVGLQYRSAMYKKNTAQIYMNCNIAFIGLHLLALDFQIFQTIVGGIRVSSRLP